MYSDMPAENEYDILNEIMLSVNIQSAIRLDKNQGAIF